MASFPESDNVRLALIRLTYKMVTHALASFTDHDPVLIDLAHLLGNLAIGEMTQLSATRPIVGLLQGIYSPKSVIWRFIQIE